MTGHKHGTDRVDVTILAECPNTVTHGDEHLRIEAEFGRAKDAEIVKEELVEVYPECGECGADLDVIVHSEPSEVLTDGGR
jgi:hypothetical protein